ncbi:cobalt ABC transporter, permease component [Streptococcus infantarius subsp. infantarius]|nr:cobalt ABC transporter, permease component [Streptococcus infantarius subsp. infantarius]MCO4638893.1 cobalt ABC transporter, permease component [Streptococcus infantarius subsp. infantarius]MCO4641898.1 cobalt ABC transporter, permease component [Streptococcus infantarius subsp. infantarius]MCO4642969.1 cobalt ABC transporter, permease component [Streptococcus infantarius subsp. infantarius]MCO4650941.1 cobalt ABC transporter, permease component [Streptococcus infantarius subsp. infantarius
MDRQSLIGYRNGQGFIYNLSAVSNLLFFLAFSVVAMVTYDTRLILCIAVFSLSLFKLSGIRYRDVSFVLFFTTVFALLNALMVYLFAPTYGVILYGAETVLWSGIGTYSITSQQLFYLLNLLLKYFCTVPVALIF